MVRTNLTTPIAELDHAHSASFSMADPSKWTTAPQTEGAALDELAANIAAVAYVPDSINVDTGTQDAGNVASLQTLDDADALEVSEVGGAPGFLIEIDYVDVIETPTRLDLHVYYDGNLAHTVNLEIYDQVGLSWDVVGTIPDGVAFEYLTYDLVNGAKYVTAGGVVNTRINHTSAGNITHDIAIDYAAVRKMPAGGGGSGQANTASNQGADGVGVYDTKVGVDLQFRHVAPASAKITTVLNGKDIDVDVDEAQLSLANLGTRAITDLSDVLGKSGAGASVVFAVSPTIVTPTIASFTNAPHDHEDAAGGATLDTAAIATGTLAHERGGIEADISAVAIGDVIVGTGAGTMALVTALGHNDGDVLTLQVDGSADWEAAPGGGAPHAMLSATHTDADESSGITRGSLIVGDATPEWSELAIYLDGTYLRSDGTDPGWDFIALADIPHTMLNDAAHSDTVGNDAVTQGSIIYGNATPKWDELVIGAAATYLRSDGMTLAWTALALIDDPSPTCAGNLDGGGYQANSFLGYVGERSGANCVMTLTTARNTITGAAVFNAQRARGDIDNPVILDNGDRVSGFQFAGYTGASYKFHAILRCEVDGAPANPGTMPLAMVMMTGSTSAIERWRTRSNGNTLVASDNEWQFRASTQAIWSPGANDLKIKADVDITLECNSDPSLFLSAGDVRLYIAGNSLMELTTNQVKFRNSGGNVYGRIYVGDATEMKLLSADESKRIRISDTGVALYDTTPVAQAAAMTANLTTITHTAPGLADYALQDLIDSSAGACFGFATKDEGNTALSCLARLQVEVAELRAMVGATAGIGVAAH